MADENPTAGEAKEISFKVRTAGDKAHSITIADSVTVLDLKKKLATEEFENVAPERMRLIYSGRVLKDADPLSKYNIKEGNIVHMVKSAAPSAAPASSASQVPTAIPMAAGTANNPLAGLTGARYAGHVSLPNRDMFGADGGVSYISSI